VILTAKPGPKIIVLKKRCNIGHLRLYFGRKDRMIDADLHQRKYKSIKFKEVN